jgi:hypothetical protein
MAKKKTQISELLDLEKTVKLLENGIPLIVLGPGLIVLPSRIDPTTGAPILECPACGATSVANVETRIVHFEHRDGCPVMSAYLQATGGAA